MVVLLPCECGQGAPSGACPQPPGAGRCCPSRHTRSPPALAPTTPYRAFEFEGRPTPAADRLAHALPDLLGGPDRGWILRAAIVSEPLAGRVLTAAEQMLDGEPRHRSAGLVAARALMGRTLVPPVGARFMGPGWLGVPDPDDGASTLAQQGLRFIIEAVGPRRARPYLERAIAVPELRVLAYGALAAEDAEAVLPHLADLLDAAPGLAADVATRFALVHTASCHAACRQIAGSPKDTRDVFAATLKRQLERIGEIRRWVECRRILFGR